jgi:PKD repeat protein
MRKNYALILLSLILISAYSYAQVGNTCTTPHVVTSLPFNATTLSTASAGNDYGSTDACGGNYLTGNDYVFAYMPMSDQIVNIVTSNTGAGVGLFLLDGCPDAGANCIATDEQQGGNPAITNVSLTGMTTYYIVVDTYDYMGFNPSTVFDIDITEAVADDVGLTRFTEPISSCGLTASEDVTVEIVNYGSNVVSNFDVTYELDGTPVTETITSSIDPDGTLTYTFTQKADLSTVGQTYEIVAYTALSGDVNTANDQITNIFTNMISVNTFPYVQDFDTDNGYWTPGGIASSWELGAPAATTINSAASGTNSWVTNLTGNHNTGENSYVISPCFDFSSLVSPMIDLNVWFETGTTGLLRVEASTNGGLTWTTIGANNDETNWYAFPGGFDTGWNGNGGGWVAASHPLDGLGGQAQVQLRLKFKMGDFGEGEGAAFDDIHIYEAPTDDLGVERIYTPVSGCELTNAEVVYVGIVNYGASSQTGFEVTYSPDGGSTLFTETVGDVVLPNDTLIYAFTTTVDVSALQTYDFVAFTTLAADADNNNDTAFHTVTNNPVVSSYPYNESFETGAGSWFVHGELPSWELGVPAGTTINTASDGVNVWATGLAGSPNDGEASYLEGPCFDFSTLTIPVLSFDIWYETSGALDGASLEYSVDGGISWGILPYGTAYTNWMDTLQNLWTGSSSGWVEAKNSLEILGGEPQVQFRFKYEDNILAAEGVAIDNITISECQSANPVADFMYTINGSEVTFTNSSTDANSYYWDLGQTLQSSTEENPVHDYMIDGNYTVTLFAYSDCGMDSTSQTIDVIVGMEEVIGSGISLYPNPVKESLTLNITDQYESIVIYSSAGSKVMSVDKNNTHQINVSEFSEGTYFVVGRNQNGIIKVPFVVVR